MIAFTKYQGTGNDFVIIDNRSVDLVTDKSTVAHICNRKYGIGADGLMLLENSDEADFKMIYFNADGNESSMCGNGGRCIAKFAKSLNVCHNRGSFMAIDGLHEFAIREDGVKLKMNDVNDIEYELDNLIMDTGSPHYVIFSDDVLEIQLVEESRKIRYNDRFRAKGINVNFVEERDGQYLMRTYERGVEDETLSCGTGTVAVALSIATRANLDEGPVEINTPGGKLSVHFKRIDGGFSDIWLDGPAEKVFDGTIQL